MSNLAQWENEVKRNYPHRYIGPDSRDGLINDTPCKIVGTKAGGYSIRVPYDRRIFTVAKSHVKTKS
jgi:hypothetical protein